MKARLLSRRQRHLREAPRGRRHEGHVGDGRGAKERVGHKGWRYRRPKSLALNRQTLSVHLVEVGLVSAQMHRRAVDLRKVLGRRRRSASLRSCVVIPLFVRCLDARALRPPDVDEQAGYDKHEHHGNGDEFRVVRCRHVSSAALQPRSRHAFFLCVCWRTG